MRIPNDSTLFEQVADFVCEQEMASYEMVMGGERFVELVAVRRLVSGVLHYQFNWSQARIARQWQFDHSSVGHYLRTMEEDEYIVVRELSDQFMEVLSASQDGVVRHRVDEERSL